MTLVPGRPPQLLLWTRPDAATPLDQAIDAELGPVTTRPAELPLTWPAAWARRRGRRPRGLATVQVAGAVMPLLPALAPLARRPAPGPTERGSGSLAAWSAAAKLALELVARHRVAPWAEPGAAGAALLTWRAAPDPADQERVERLAASLPPAARACAGTTTPGRGAPPQLLTAPAALRSFLDAAADALVRGVSRPSAGSDEDWSRRAAAALLGPDGALALRPLVDDPLVAELQGWAARATIGGSGDGLRLVLRLATPPADDDQWPLQLAATAAWDPSLELEADAVWGGRRDDLPPGRDPAALRGSFLAELGRAARIWPPLGEGLRGPSPTRLPLAPERVAQLVGEAAPLLRAAGIEVRVPAELTAAGRRRLRTRLVARTATPQATREAAGGFGLASIAEARWEAMLDDQALDAAELERLARLKQPLIRLRGQWVLLDRREVDEVARRVRSGEWRLEGAAAMAAALLEEDELVLADDDPLARLRELLRQEPPDLGAIPGLAGRLRPYQRRGAGWLERLDAAGLGGILADDMGLGKTVQLLAFLLHRDRLRRPAGPHLLVCPTSVLGGWEREAARFAPSLAVYRHYGADRAAGRRAFARATPPGSLCLTTYGLLRRDRELLAARAWQTVTLDEAQAVKNPTSQVARAACALGAGARFALTGTPVENRLGELWSLLRFAVPGLLGPERRFLSELALPIERYRSGVALERLHRLTAPFVLRRAKTDPGVLPDLPPKLVMRTACPLTAEQATLYRAAVDDAMETIRTAAGIDRRGRVLALITTLKQVCNHPEQALPRGGRLAGRSGKLDRLGDELEEVLAEGEAALVFSQYRTMGDLLVRYLAERLGVRAPFLHGGVPQAERERMVASFQHPDGPPVMVISLRAGGTGLTLTRASHVYHFDRWWNPAVEDQASDRAHRIGQRRTVVVHPMVCRGTLEERIDAMLGEKAELAALAVRSGDAFVTELDDARLEALVRLGDAVEEAP